MERRFLDITDPEKFEWVTRPRVDQDHVDDLARDLAKGRPLPPPAAVMDAEGHAFGFRGKHIALAHRANDVEFEVQPGARQDALLRAVQENHETGDRQALKRSKADREWAIDGALHLPEERGRGVNHIVKLTGTYRKLVVERVDVLKQQGILELSQDGESIVVCRVGSTFKQKAKKTSVAQLEAFEFIWPAISNGRESKYLFLCDGRVTAANGVISMSAKLEGDLPTCRPLASVTMEGLKSIGGTVELELAEDGRLRLCREGKSRMVECSTDAFLPLVPSGEFIEGWPVLTRMADWVGPEGVLLEGDRAFARHGRRRVSWVLESPVPRSIRLPRDAAQALPKEKVERVQVDDASITFHYRDRWLWSRLMDKERGGDDWSILDFEPGRTPVPEGFFSALKRLRSLST